MKWWWLKSAGEFGLVAAIGLMLTVRAPGAAPPERLAPLPSAADVDAAIAFAEQQAEQVNGPAR